MLPELDPPLLEELLLEEELEPPEELRLLPPRTAELSLNRLVVPRRAPKLEPEPPVPAPEPSEPDDMPEPPPEEPDPEEP